MDRRKRYSVVERLPDGRERTLATGLVLAEARTVYARVTWAGTIRQERS